MYEDVAKGVVVSTKTVTDKLGWRWEISFPSSTMESMWCDLGEAGYNTILSFISSFLLDPKRRREAVDPKTQNRLSLRACEDEGDESIF